MDLVLLVLWALLAIGMLVLDGVLQKVSKVILNQESRVGELEDQAGDLQNECSGLSRLTERMLLRLDELQAEKPAAKTRTMHGPTPQRPTKLKDLTTRGD